MKVSGYRQHQPSQERDKRQNAVEYRQRFNANSRDANKTRKHSWLPNRPVTQQR